MFTLGRDRKLNPNPSSLPDSAGRFGIRGATVVSQPDETLHLPLFFGQTRYGTWLDYLLCESCESQRHTCHCQEYL